MKSLESIQKLHNIGKILSKIGFVFCIVGIAGCSVGLISMILLPEALKLGGVTLHGFIEETAEMNMSTVYASIVSGIITCIGYAILCNLTNKYCINELKAGTPFTFEGAKELNKLGLYSICVPIIVNCICQIVIQIFSYTLGKVEDLDVDNISSVAFGLMIVIVSLVYKYGAEIVSSRSQENEQYGVQQ